MTDVGIGQMMALTPAIEILEVPCCYGNAPFDNVCKDALHLTAP